MQLCFRLLQIWFTYFLCDAGDAFSKKLYDVVIFVSSFLISFFNLMFSNYVLKILATFLAFFKADQKC